MCSNFDCTGYIFDKFTTLFLCFLILFFLYIVVSNTVYTIYCGYNSMIHVAPLLLYITGVILWLNYLYPYIPLFKPFPHKSPPTPTQRTNSNKQFAYIMAYLIIYIIIYTTLLFIFYIYTAYSRYFCIHI